MLGELLARLVLKECASLPLIPAWEVDVSDGVLEILLEWGRIADLFRSEW